MWWNDIPLDTRERTIGNHLQDAGYATGYFGKLHVDGAHSHTDTAKFFGFNDTFLYEDWKNLGIQWDIDIDNAVRDEFMSIMGQKAWTGKLSQR
jgi:arylsulfatase A-like enzyme